jgi:HEAT repeat protein
MAEEEDKHPADPARSRGVYVAWGVAFVFLALLAAFVWFLLRPYLEVRAAVGRLAKKESTAEAEVKRLGGPEKAAAKSAFYARLPSKLAPYKLFVFNILGSSVSAAMPVCVAMLGDRDAGTRGSAALALGRIGDRRAVESLILALADSDTFVRESAISALGKLGDPRSVNALCAALNDSNDFVRFDAATALGELKDPRAVEPLIAALKDPDPEIRGQAAAALGKIGDPKAVGPLKAVLKNLNGLPEARARYALKQLEALPPEKGQATQQKPD